MIKLRSAHWWVFVGIFLIIVAVTLQIKLKSNYTELKSLDPITTKELYNPQGNSVSGNPNGNITLVEFFDYNCGTCREMHSKITELATANPDLRIVYKEFLLFGEPSLAATSAALAAQKQGKYTQLQTAFTKATQPLTQDEVLKIAEQTGLNVKKLKVDMASSEIQKQVQANTQLAKKLGIDGVPAFILTNSVLAKNPEKTGIPQYVFKGSNHIEATLQHLIDQVKKDKT